MSLCPNLGSWRHELSENVWVEGTLRLECGKSGIYNNNRLPAEKKEEKEEKEKEEKEKALRIKIAYRSEKEEEKEEKKENTRDRSVPDGSNNNVRIKEITPNSKKIFF